MHRTLLLVPFVGLGLACGSADDGALEDAATIAQETGPAPMPPLPEPLACRADDDVDQVVQRVAPRDTDPRIREGDPDHLYVEPTDPVGTLFVFVPGATARPDDYTRILQTAASQGHHAIGLAYVNDDPVNLLCNRLSPPRCRDDLRTEIIYGVVRSDLVEVDRPNSIVSRLVRLLLHLGWRQYLTPNGLDWGSITFAGHSQGSGHAAFIGRDHRVRRVILFAGTEASDWTLDPRATPGERTYGFAHVDDPLFASFPRSWTNFEAPGPLTDVDTANVPFGRSHQLTTDLPPANGNAHNAPVADEATPIDGDTPVYRPVWCHVIDG